MRYGYANPIGAMLAIAIGVTAFAAWLYVCYPGTAGELADESRQSWSFLVLLGFVVVAVIGVTTAGSVLQCLLMLLRSLLQLSLVVAIVVGGVLLWRREPTENQVQPAISSYRDYSSTTEEVITPVPKPTKGRWWEQKKSE